MKNDDYEPSATAKRAEIIMIRMTKKTFGYE
jgi:hypothetical protein